MFCNNGLHSDVKVIDFGLSQKYCHNDRLHETSGTIYTMAPEVLRGDYDEVADIWSLGVITFMLLSSSLPFFGGERSRVANKILAGQFKMIGPRWKKVSEESKEFVRHLLVRNPGDRPSATEALREDWISSSLLIDDDDDELLDNVQASMEVFSNHYCKLKRLALMVIAHKATSEEIGYLRCIFDRYDRSHHGMIMYEDFHESLQAFGYNEEDIPKMFNRCDLDGTGIIHYSTYRFSN